MPSLTFSIGGPEIDISNKSSKEVLDIIKKEYNKKKSSSSTLLKNVKKIVDLGHNIMMELDLTIVIKIILVGENVKTNLIKINGVVSVLI